MARASYLEDTCKSALNRVPDAARVPFRWTINPYRGCTHACHYCFARAFHAYLDLGVGEDFSTKIVIKTNLVEVLRRELAAPKWTGETIAMGTATDPYQHCEGRYGLTRGAIEALIEAQNPLSMLTKSTMIVRDLELYVRLGEVADVSVCMSVGTLDEDVRRVVEPGTPPGRKRLEILGRFAAAGIRTGVLVAPVLPGLTDDDAHLDEVLEACAEEGIAWATVIPLHIRPGIRRTSSRGSARPTRCSPLGTSSCTARAPTRRGRTRRSSARASPGCASGTASPAPRAGFACAARSAGNSRSPSDAHNAHRHGLHIEDYGLLGDTQTAALVGQRRVDRLAVHAPLRLRCVLRRAARGA